MNQDGRRGEASRPKIVEIKPPQKASNPVNFISGGTIKYEIEEEGANSQEQNENTKGVSYAQKYAVNCAFNNANWINESNGKLVLQMMERMGYEQGKGLGKSKQGIVEPIKALRNPGKLALGAEKKSVFYQTGFSQQQQQAAAIPGHMQNLQTGWINYQEYINGSVQRVESSLSREAGCSSKKNLLQNQGMKIDWEYEQNVGLGGKKKYNRNEANILGSCSSSSSAIQHFAGGLALGKAAAAAAGNMPPPPFHQRNKRRQKHHQTGQSEGFGGGGGGIKHEDNVKMSLERAGFTKKDAGEVWEAICVLAKHGIMNKGMGLGLVKKRAANKSYQQSEASIE